MLIWDTGGSFGLTPFRSEFIDYVRADITVIYVTKSNHFIGVGTTIQKCVELNGTTCYLPCVSYHLPSIDV